MSKQLLRVFSLLIVFSMVLAACQTTPKAEAYKCTDAIGCVTVQAG